MSAQQRLNDRKRRGSRKRSRSVTWRVLLSHRKTFEVMEKTGKLSQRLQYSRACTDVLPVMME